MAVKPKKTLIVYYSYTGNNKLIAEYVGAKLSTDVCPIIEENKRSGWTNFMDILFRRTPKIQQLKKNIQNYDHILFLAPLWAGRIANPLKSLLKQERNSIKEYSFVSLCSGSRKTDQMTKVKAELQELTGKDPVNVLELAVANLFSEKEQRKIMTVSGYRVKSTDLEYYKNQLKTIIEPLAPKETYTPTDYQKTL